jgi:ABC-type nitrate/sulfonate/bicarbonate transport system ATPase subunit
MENFVTIPGCSGGGKSTLLAEPRRRGFGTIEEPQIPGPRNEIRRPEPGRQIVAEELKPVAQHFPR